jgi:hypothetical protein
MIKRDWDLLFYDQDLSVVLSSQLEGVRDAVERINPGRLRSIDFAELERELLHELDVEPLAFREEDISVDTEESRIDVTHDFDRGFFPGEGRSLVSGLQVTYYLPFTGDPRLLRCRPNVFTLNPPRAVIAQGELQFPYDSVDRVVEATKRQFNQDLQTVKEWAGRVNAQVNAFAATLGVQVRQELTARRSHLAAAASAVADLGYKVRSPAATPTASAGKSPASPASQRVAAANPMAEAKAHGRYDVALSFAGEDRVYVERVATSLKERGLSVFYDAFETVDLWGKNLVDHLAEVYGERSRFIVMFISSHYAAKAWPTHERQHAQARALRQQEEYILPARFDDTIVPGLPQTVSYVDLRTCAPEALADLIVTKVSRPR